MVLNESKRDDLLQPYVDLLATKGINTSISYLKKYLLKKFVEEGNFRNLSLGSNFYLAGVARYYFNGDLTTDNELGIYTESPDNWNEEVCTRLNELILILRNAYVDTVGETFEQPEDFGTLSLPKLLRKYGKKIDAALEKVAQSQNNETEDEMDNHTGNGYTYEIIYSYEQARKYYSATAPGSWCITYGENYYNSYIRNLNIHYVVFAKEGYEKVPRVKEEEMWKGNKPQDTYGNSLICLLQSNVDGRPVYITSRWNHGAEGMRVEADHAYTPEEFFNIVGIDQSDLDKIYRTWLDKKDYSKKLKSSPEYKEEMLKSLRELKYMQMRINGGESPDQVLGELDPKYVAFGNGKWSKSIAIYKFKTKYGDKAILVDRGQFLFETVKDNEMEFGIFKTDKEWGGGRCWIKDCVTIGNGEGASDPAYIYSARFHRFVEVDGIKKFNYICNSYTENPILYPVFITGKKRAMINTRNQMPLTFPDGSHWFYGFNYRTKRGENARDFSLKPINPTEGFIIFYFNQEDEGRPGRGLWYDTYKNEFIPEPTDTLSDGTKLYSPEIQRGSNTLPYGWQMLEWGGGKYCTTLYYKGKRVSFDGIETFASSYIRGNHKETRFISLVPSDVTDDYNGNYWSRDTSVILDLEKGELLKDPVENKPIYCWYTNYDYRGIVEIKFYEGNRMYFIESENKFAKNPFDGSYILKTSSSLNKDEKNWPIYCTIEKGIWFRPFYQKIRNEDEIPEDMRQYYWKLVSYAGYVVFGSWKDLIEGHLSSDAECKPLGLEVYESISIHKEDIRRMVNEAVVRIIKSMF